MKPEINPQDLATLLAIEKMITENIRYHYTIRELAKKVGTNEYKLKKLFREQFNIGMYGYLSKKRMEKARELLELTDKSIREIAAATGYKYVTSFITAFKKEYQEAPAAWRLRHQKKD